MLVRIQRIKAYSVVNNAAHLGSGLPCPRHPPNFGSDLNPSGHQKTWGIARHCCATKNVPGINRMSSPDPCHINNMHSCFDVITCNCDVSSCGYYYFGSIAINYQSTVAIIVRSNGALIVV